MKTFLKWLGFYVLFSQIFKADIPILGWTILGYSIKYLLYYSFIFGVTIFWWLAVLKKREASIQEIVIMTLESGTFITGILWGWPLKDVVLEFVRLLMPVFIYQWIELIEIEKKEYFYLFIYTNIVAGLISVLVAFRIIDTNIWAAEGDYVRSAGAVDSTICIGGVILSLVLLYVYPDDNKKRQLLLLINLISSILTAVFSQSRTRIVIILALFIIVFFYNIFNKQSKGGSLRFLILLILAFVAAVILFPEELASISRQIIGRFSNLSNQDINISVRDEEMMQQIECFKTSPIIGLGCGAIAQHEHMYYHNLYTTFLMIGGLMFGGAYILWYFSYLIKAFVHLIKGRNLSDALVSFLFMITLTILGYTNAGIIQSGGYLMMVFIFLDDKKRRIKTLQ